MPVMEKGTDKEITEFNFYQVEAPSNKYSCLSTLSWDTGFFYTQPQTKTLVFRLELTSLALLGSLVYRIQNLRLFQNHNVKSLL